MWKQFLFLCIFIFSFAFFFSSFFFFTTIPHHQQVAFSKTHTCTTPSQEREKKKLWKKIVWYETQLRWLQWIFLSFKLNTIPFHNFEKRSIIFEARSCLMHKLERILWNFNCDLSTKCSHIQFSHDAITWWTIPTHMVMKSYRKNYLRNVNGWDRRERAKENRQREKKKVQGNNS